jgi:Domain of unknown function (DUF1918)
MMSTGTDDRPQVGDVVAVKGHRVGDSGRTGEILEVIGEPGHEHFRVRWEDETESIFYPSSDTVIHPHSQVKQRKR